MSRNELIVTVGLPQSGKSSWARTQPHPIVNPDSIRLALHGKPFIGLAEPFVWAIAKVMVRALFFGGHETVIVDATNTTRKRRNDWKSGDWMRRYKLFEASVEVCKERAAETAIDDTHRDGLLAAIDRMHEQFEPIGDDEIDELKIERWRDGT